MTHSKLLLTALAAGFLTLAAQPALAASGASIQGGVPIVIADTTSGASLTYNPSPGVSMGYFTKADTYAITSTNLSAGIDNRMEYGIANNRAGYYQVMETNPEEGGVSSKTTNIADTPEPWTDIQVPSDTNFLTWTYMGGAATGGS